MKKILLFASLLLFIAGCSSTNPYMTAGTDQYKSVTEKVLGEWKMNYFQADKKNVIGSKFANAKLNLDASKRDATFTFYLPKTTINTRLKDWKTEFPGIKVDSYAVIATAKWKVDNKGETIFFDPVDSFIDIKGSGENFEGFFGSETMKFEGTKAAKDRGNYDSGIGGLLTSKIAGSITAKATGTEDFFIQVDMGKGYWILDLKNKSYTLDNRLGGLIKVNK